MDINDEKWWLLGLKNRFDVDISLVIKTKYRDDGTSAFHIY